MSDDYVTVEEAARRLGISVEDALDLLDRHPECEVVDLEHARRAVEAYQRDEAAAEQGRPLLVGVREAARRLGIHHSTVADGLQRYPDVHRERRGNRLLLDLHAFAARYFGDYQREVMSGEASGLRRRPDPSII